MEKSDGIGKKFTATFTLSNGQERKFSFTAKDLASADVDARDIGDSYLDGPWVRLEVKRGDS